MAAPDGARHTGTAPLPSTGRHDVADRRPEVDLAGLPSLAPLPTATERAAEVIRDNIFEGRFRPGTALPENLLAQALRVSRNTVREALRLLVNQHLLSYQAHKGVTVRRLGAADIRDIYRLRRLLELASIDALRAGTGTLDAGALESCLSIGDRAAGAGDWTGVGTANLRFHAGIVAVQGSRRLDEFFRLLMTEMRLGFLSLPDQRALHEPYLRRNHRIADHLRAGQLDRAYEALEEYLAGAMAQVVAAVPD